MLNPYMVYDTQAGSSEAAVLVFAATAQEARKIAWPAVRNWLSYNFIDLSCRRLQGDWLYKLGDQAKLSAGVPHVIDDLPSCRSCTFWTSQIGDDGLCDDCREMSQPAKASSS